MGSKCGMGWGGRRQRTILANPRKIQNSNKPHKLNFSWGREFMMQSYMQHQDKVFLYFCYQLQAIFLRRLGSMTFESTDEISTSQYEFTSRYSCPLRNWYLSNLQSVFLQFRDWYLSKMQFVWEQRHLWGECSPYLRFYAFQIQVNRCWFPSQGNNLFAYLLHNLVAFLADGCLPLKCIVLDEGKKRENRKREILPPIVNKWSKGFIRACFVFRICEKVPTFLTSQVLLTYYDIAVTHFLTFWLEFSFSSLAETCHSLHGNLNLYLECSCICIVCICICC